MKKIVFGGVAAALALSCSLASAQTTSPTPPPAQTQAAPAGTQASAYSDAQLRSYATASAEIGHINAGLSANATTAQRAQAETQVNGVLTRNNIDRATYDGIAARARTDTALQARIASFATPAHSPG